MGSSDILSPTARALLIQMRSGTLTNPPGKNALTELVARGYARGAGLKAVLTPAGNFAAKSEKSNG